MMALATTTANSLRPLVRHAAPVRSMSILSKQSGEEYKKMNYNERMKKTGRPVSPHVTIYAFPVTALSSIANRVTGMTLSIGCVGLGAVEMLGGSGSALSLMESIGSTSLAMPAKFCVAFPLTYHYLGGVRHFLWDSYPDMLTNKDATQASYYLLGGSVALSGVAMFM